MGQRDKAPLILRRTRHGLEAVDQIDADTLEQIPIGHSVEVSIKHRKRSLPQLRLYWKLLSEVVKATGKFPSPEHMHDEIKMALGYAEQRVAFDGRTYYRPDSTAFEKMGDVEFKVYFDRAMELIAREMGIDPLAAYEEMKAA